MKMQETSFQYEKLHTKTHFETEVKATRKWLTIFSQFISLMTPAVMSLPCQKLLTFKMHNLKSGADRTNEHCRFN